MTESKIIADDALVPVKEAKPLIPAGTTRIYQLLNSGQLEAKKNGNRTLITGRSINAYRARLPAYSPRGSSEVR